MPEETDEEHLRRVRVALADLGYDPLSANLGDHLGDYGNVRTILFDFGIPFAIGYMAVRLSSHEAMACWACANSGNGEACYWGDCQSPEGPKLPPRELLKRGD